MQNNEHHNLLDCLTILERELHRATANTGMQRLSELLHPDFREYGRSGREYDFATIAEHLLTQTREVVLHAQHFAVQQLASNLALMTYQTADQHDNGEFDRHTLRSSIWQYNGQIWQMIFHQGTATAEFPIITHELS